jgi:hypothetical protein
VSVEVVRLLLRAGASEAEVEEALGRAVAAGQSLARALEDGEPALKQRLERELERVELASLEIVRPELEQLGLLPDGLADRLGIIPVRKDPRSGRIDVAALDPLDGHVVTELEFHLGEKVRVLRADSDAMKAALVATGASSARLPSGPPLPLVRKAVSSELKLPTIVVGGSEPPPSADEPVLSLSRPKTPQTTPAPGPVFPLELAKSAFEEARTPDDVVSALITGLAPARTAVLAVRSSSFVGRAGSSAFERDAVRRVEVLGSSPSVLQTATRAGFYLGALPHTAAHDSLRALFGATDDEVYVATVTVSGHPSLVVICDPSALGGSSDATERVDVLAVAAGRALERILVSRKRGS